VALGDGLAPGELLVPAEGLAPGPRLRCLALGDGLGAGEKVE
jgi:hypothetical protein